MSGRAKTSMPGATDPGSPPPALAYGYRRRDGEDRNVLVAVDETDTWLVYDVPTRQAGEATGLLVERLTGSDDRLEKALPLALDYWARQTAFHADEHPRPDPLPKPRAVPLPVALEHAERAERAVRVHHTQQAAARAA